MISLLLCYAEEPAGPGRIDAVVEARRRGLEVWRKMNFSVFNDRAEGRDLVVFLRVCPSCEKQSNADQKRETS